MRNSRGTGWTGWGCLLVMLALGCNSTSHGPGTGDPSQPPEDGQTPPDGPDGTSTGHKPGVTPEQGATEFFSADPGGQPVGSRNAGPAGLSAETADTATLDGASAGMSTRSVERGDIFRLLPDQRILNLNSYRGVQIIDVSDLSAPRLEGRLAISGSPIELYVVGERAIVLLNGWRGYYGSRDDVSVETVEGGLILSVDISDRANPELLDQAYVPGSITTSRLTQGGDQAALYVAAQLYETYSNRGVVTGAARTVIKSFDVSNAAFVERSELDLGGYVQDIQATTDVMMVASYDYNATSATSTVGLVDISSPDGRMVQGDVITAAGMVQNKFNMDVQGGVLRVVSGSTWAGTATNHLETFDVSDLGSSTALDHCTFGDGQSLFATLFVEDKGFFVTYLRQDPFHAFTIDAQGQCQEHNEFIVSGWNDFFRAVGGNTRMIGIGRNDEGQTNKLAVSLYDISDVTNPEPLLARADIDLSWGWSEASWDDRAFSVIEDAVSAQAEDGTEETGLVLLPFEGWNMQDETYLASVQIFTFSDHTLTQRGAMDHGTPVRRSFQSEPGVAANLSEEQLSLFATTDADAPEELGRVDVAPNYAQVFVFGDHVVRLRDQSYYYGTSTAGARARVEVLPRSANLDTDAPVASLSVPAHAQFVQVGDLLVATVTEYRSTVINVEQYDTTIEVFDFSNPRAPRARGTLQTDRITPGYGGYYGGLLVDCFDCGRGWGYGYGGGGLVAGEALVFAEQQPHQRSIGFINHCYENPHNPPCTYDATTGGESCPQTWYTGGIQCSTPRGGEETCSGEFYVCDSDSCEPGEPALGTERYCYEGEEYRYWSSYSFEVVDLRDPDQPALAPTVEAPEADEGTSTLAAGDAVYFNYQRQATIEGDPRPYVQRFFRKLDVSDPSAPVLGAGINVPGDVIAADGDTIFTRDLVWDDTATETLIARLTVSGDRARLNAQRFFDDRAVSAVQLDDAGHVLVSHDPIYSYYYGYYGSNGDVPPQHRLSILDTDDLAVAGELDVDEWATFFSAKAGRAIYTVSGGLLVVNVSDAAHPFAQAYFPTDGWSSNLLLDGDEILFAAGPYGIYRFDSSVFNLLTR